MEELKQKINALVRESKRKVPSSRGSAAGLSEKLTKVQKLLPELQKEMNVLLTEHLNGREITDSERKEAVEIFQIGVREFLK